MHNRITAHVEKRRRRYEHEPEILPDKLYCKSCKHLYLANIGIADKYICLPCIKSAKNNKFKKYRQVLDAEFHNKIGRYLNPSETDIREAVEKVLKDHTPDHHVTEPQALSYAQILKSQSTSQLPNKKSKSPLYTGLLVVTDILNIIKGYMNLL